MGPSSLRPLWQAEDSPEDDAKLSPAQIRAVREQKRRRERKPQGVIKRGWLEIPYKWKFIYSTWEHL